MKRKSLLFGLVLFVLASCGKSNPHHHTTTTTSPSTSRTIPSEGFYFFPNTLQIDLKDGKSGVHTVINTLAPNDTINWTIPKSNLISFEKLETKSNEDNVYHAFNTGSLEISATWNNQTIKCNIQIVNTAAKKTVEQRKSPFMLLTITMDMLMRLLVSNIMELSLSRKLINLIRSSLTKVILGKVL